MGKHLFGGVLLLLLLLLLTVRLLSYFAGINPVCFVVVVFFFLGSVLPFAAFSISIPATLYLPIPLRKVRGGERKYESRRLPYPQEEERERERANAVRRARSEAQKLGTAVVADLDSLLRHQEEGHALVLLRIMLCAEVHIHRLPYPQKKSKSKRTQWRLLAAKYKSSGTNKA